MKVIQPSTEILLPFVDKMKYNPGNRVENLKFIEQCGRLSYKSEKAVTDTSYITFIENLKEKGHTSVLEHGSLYLKFTWVSLFSLAAIIFYIKSIFNKYTVVRWNKIYTNYRVLYEVHQDRVPAGLSYFVPDRNDPNLRISVRFVCDRGISHELVRHRVFSFIQESTRWCNYCLGKFSNELTFIYPSWMKQGSYSEDETMPYDERVWFASMEAAENSYTKLIGRSWIPSRARSVLPNSLKTELIITGSIKQWKAFFKLRCAPDAHEQMRQLTKPLILQLDILTGAFLSSVEFKEAMQHLFDAHKDSLNKA